MDDNSIFLLDGFSLVEDYRVLLTESPESKTLCTGGETNMEKSLVNFLVMTGCQFVSMIINFMKIKLYCVS